MILKFTNLDEWHGFFAILPHQTINTEVTEYVWLQRAERRRVYIGFAIDDVVGHSEYRWEYRS